MKEVLSFIEQKKQEFARLPLFEFMQDTSIEPRQRLSFAPCLAPFAMAFGELNKSVFRDDPTDDPIQKLINTHTREDDRHWLWYLEDLQRLGLNQPVKMNDALRFLWSEETQASRHLVYELYRLTYQATPIQKLVAIECIEATGNVMSTVVLQVEREIRPSLGKELIYFGEIHLLAETGHATGSDDIENFLKSIQLSEKEQQQAFESVEIVFEAFTNLIQNLLVYTQKHRLEISLTAA